MNSNTRSAVAFLVAATVFGGIASAQEDYQVLKAFGEHGANEPSTGLIRADDGNFYGGTATGASNPKGGTVFRLTPDGTFTVISILDRPLFNRNLMQASDGYLYGATDTAILRIGLDGTTIVLHTFGPLSVEGRLVTPLVDGDDGLFYGLQTFGPNHDTTRLVSMTPSGELNTSPAASQLEGIPGDLAKGRDGFFYVNEPLGGLGYGSIVRVSRDGLATTLHVFGNDLGGSWLGGVLQASDGNLYGTTTRSGAYGHGTIFRLGPGSEFTLLYSFNPEVDRIFEVRQPLLEGHDGNLYGIGDTGIFRITRDGAFKLLHSVNKGYPEWAGSERYGRFAGGEVAEGPGGDLYGTQRGWAPGDGGAVFRLKHDRSACADDVRPVWKDFDGGTLYLLGALKNETRALWGAWLVTGQGVKRLWLVVTPPVTPTFVFEVYMPLAPVGKIGVFTAVLTSDGHVCSDWSTTDSAGSGSTSDDLKQILESSGALAGTGIVIR